MRSRCCVTCESLLYTSPEEVYQQYINFASCYSPQPIILLDFHLCPSHCCRSFCTNVKASHRGPTAMAHHTPPCTTRLQIPLSSSSSTSRSPPPLPHPACRGKCRATSSGHHCPTMGAKHTTEGEFYVSYCERYFIIKKDLTNASQTTYSISQKFGQTQVWWL